MARVVIIALRYRRVTVSSRTAPLDAPVARHAWSTSVAAGGQVPSDHMSDTPTPTEAARVSSRAVHDLSATFMLDAETYLTAAQAGYEGISFYFGGRGGVLGEVDSGVVHEAFVFFPAETVSAAWEKAATVESRAEAARRFAEAAHGWAVAHLPDGALDYRRLADLAGKVVAAADGTGAAVFEGWRDLPEPDGERELALHRMNSLRELRAARHARAVEQVGLEPIEAFMVKSPYMAGIFGWPKPESEPDQETVAKWERAEELTNERFGEDLAALDPDELAEFCELAEAARTAAT